MSARKGCPQMVYTVIGQYGVRAHHSLTGVKVPVSHLGLLRHPIVGTLVSSLQRGEDGNPGSPFGLT